MLFLIHWVYWFSVGIFPKHGMVGVDSCLSLFKCWLKILSKQHSSSCMFHILLYFHCMFWSCKMFPNWHVMCILSCWRACLFVPKMAMESITRLIQTQQCVLWQWHKLRSWIVATASDVFSTEAKLQCQPLEILFPSRGLAVVFWP